MTVEIEDVINARHEGTITQQDFDKFLDGDEDIPAIAALDKGTSAEGEGAGEEIKDDGKKEPSVVTPEVPSKVEEKTPGEDLAQQALERATKAEQALADLGIQFSEQKKLIDQLTAAKADDALTGTTDKVDNLLSTLEEDYPGVKADLLKLLTPVIAPLQEKISSIDAKGQQEEQEQAALEGQRRFDNAVIEVHSDYKTVTDPKNEKFWEWMHDPARPSWVQMSMDSHRTSPKLVAEVISLFKSEKGKAQDAGKNGDNVKIDEKKVADAIKKADETQPKVNSLSDIPGGPKPLSSEEKAETMNNSQLNDLFHGKTPGEINKMLDKMV